MLIRLRRNRGPKPFGTRYIKLNALAFLLYLLRISLVELHRHRVQCRWVCKRYLQHAYPIITRLEIADIYRPKVIQWDLLWSSQPLWLATEARQIRAMSDFLQLQQWKTFSVWSVQLGFNEKQIEPLNTKIPTQSLKPMEMYSTFLHFAMSLVRVAPMVCPPVPT